MANLKSTKIKNQNAADLASLNYGRRVINFLRFGYISFIISMILVVISIVVMFTKGFNLGPDFTGGTTIEITFKKSANIDEIRKSLNEIGYKEPIVQHYGSSHDVIIRLPVITENDESKAKQVQNVNSEIASNISSIIHQEIDSDAIIKRVAFVGPTVGSELAQNGILAICAALICILIYVAVRFEWRLGTGAVVALAHDVVITAGYLSLFQRELDLTIVAAMLSIIGYSLNDTIVVFDRIRENFRKIRRASSYDVIDISLTQTLSRTLMTSAITLVVVIILYIFGGNLLQGFAETLGIGIVLGTFSSIYVAAYMSLKLGVKREYFIPQKVEVEGADKPKVIH